MNEIFKNDISICALTFNSINRQSIASLDIHFQEMHVHLRKKEIAMQRLTHLFLGLKDV